MDLRLPLALSVNVRISVPRLILSVVKKMVAVSLQDQALELPFLKTNIRDCCVGLRHTVFCVI